MTGRPRLLVVASTFPVTPGDGTPSFVWDLALEESKDFDVTVLAPAMPGAPGREIREGIEIHRFRYFLRSFEDLATGAILDNLKSRRSRWLQVAPFFIGETIALRKLARRLHPSIVHAHWIVPQGIVAAFVARGVPLLVTTPGGDVYALSSPPLRSMKRAVVRTAAAVTVMNEDMRRRVIDLGADPAKVFVLPMGAVFAGLDLADRDRDRVLFAGRLVEKKGLSVLLDAIEDTDLAVDVVGDGPSRGDLEARARELPNDVRFLGTLDRQSLGDAMARAAVFVVPSIRARSGDQEGLPVVLLEAMAAGCAVIASRLPGIDEVITDGVEGLLVEPGDPNALRSALLNVTGDREFASALGAAARARAEDYSIAAIGERYRKLLHRILAPEVGRG